MGEGEVSDVVKIVWAGKKRHGSEVVALSGDVEPLEGAKRV